MSLAQVPVEPGPDLGPVAPAVSRPPPKPAAEAFSEDPRPLPRYHSARLALSLPLPDGRAWRIDDHSGAERVATHAATRSRVMLATFRADVLVGRSQCEALARDRMLVIVWEDLHWADEGTLELIEYLAQWLQAPVLQICLGRDELLELSPEWGSVRHSTTSILLERLDGRDTRRLMDLLAQRAGAALELSDSLVERSGGNPLFAEALIARIAEEGADASAELPDTLQGLLAARLDSLEPAERQLLCHASVAGRSFSAEALACVSPETGIDLARAIANLREKNLIALGDDRGEEGERELVFTHALIRDVAYEMLPKAVRARKHAEVGAFIERRAADRGEGAVALLAEHFAVNPAALL